MKRTSNGTSKQKPSGFRQFHKTEDQARYLSQESEDAFQVLKLVFATWVNLPKVFDKDWTDGLVDYWIVDWWTTRKAAEMWNHRQHVALDSILSPQSQSQSQSIDTKAGEYCCNIGCHREGCSLLHFS